MLALSCLLLGSCSSLPGNRGDLFSLGKTFKELPACADNFDLFPLEKIDEWNGIYEQKIASVLSADSQAKISCKDDARSLATPALQELAGLLPQWKNLDRELFESDMPEVLLDTLEAYGCALKTDEQQRLLLELAQKQKEGSDEECKGFASQAQCEDRFPCAWSGECFLSNDVNTLRKELQKVNRKRNKQLSLARESLKRTLLVVTGMNKLRPLRNSFICINRTSKDLRNLLGLAAETAECVPLRTWDVRGQLRYLPEGATKP
jgi:hypothetical protein